MAHAAYYDTDLFAQQAASPVPLEILESDIDLYWHIALTMYGEIEAANERDCELSFIVPVGPVYQYRRFVDLMRRRTLSMKKVHLFFMDEYLSDEKTWIPAESPLSFRGFIQRELTEALPKEAGLTPANIHFPDPKDPAAYDTALAAMNGPDVCIAGVGITGHMAFNEPPEPGQSMSVADFSKLPSRVIRLARESIAINSNTAMRGAMDEVPPLAVTVGMQQILSAKRLRIYFNRPWQSAVVRRFLFGEMTSAFPVTLARSHPDVRAIMTQLVAEKPEFALK